MGGGGYSRIGSHGSCSEMSNRGGMSSRNRIGS